MDFLAIFLDFEAVFAEHSRATFKKANEKRQKKSKKDNFWLSVNTP